MVQMTRFAPCPSCCGECIYFTDNFDSDSIAGGDWDEVDGSWSIASGGMETTDSDAIVQCLEPHPTGGPALLFHTAILHTYNAFGFPTDWTDGDEYHVIVDYVDDTHYFFCRITCVSNYNYTIQLFQQDGAGPESALTESILIAGPVCDIIIAMSAVGVGLDVYHGYTLGQRSAWRYFFYWTDELSSQYVALGTGTVTGTARFAYIELHKHYLTYEECRNIAPCLYCGGEEEMPHQLKLTLANIIENPTASTPCGNCPDLNGVFYLDFHHSSTSDLTCVYRYTFPSDVCNYAYLEATVTDNPFGDQHEIKVEYLEYPYTGPFGYNHSMQWVNNDIDPCSGALDEALTFSGQSDATYDYCSGASSTCQVETVR